MVQSMCNIANTVTQQLEFLCFPVFYLSAADVEDNHS